jgi:DNA-binding MarR family transcriptional regulator
VAGKADAPGANRTEPLGRDARAVRTWVRLARVYGQLVRALAAQVREHGLTIAQFDVLTHVVRSEGLNQQELAAELLVTKGNVSHLVDRLETAGLIERRAGKGRTYHLYPTAAGRALREAIVPPHNALIAKLLASVPDDRLTTLHTTLRDLDRALE